MLQDPTLPSRKGRPGRLCFGLLVCVALAEGSAGLVGLRACIVDNLHISGKQAAGRLNTSKGPAFNVDIAALRCQREGPVVLEVPDELYILK